MGEIYQLLVSTKTVFLDLTAQSEEIYTSKSEETKIVCFICYLVCGLIFANFGNVCVLFACATDKASSG